MSVSTPPEPFGPARLDLRQERQTSPVSIPTEPFGPARRGALEISPGWIGFNPHRAFRPGATYRSMWWLWAKCRFQSPPSLSARRDELRAVLCRSGQASFNPHRAFRPGATAGGSIRCRRQPRFNPHRAFRPGATAYPFPLSFLPIFRPESRISQAASPSGRENLPPGQPLQSQPIVRRRADPTSVRAPLQIGAALKRRADRAGRSRDAAQTPPGTGRAAPAAGRSSGCLPSAPSPPADGA